MIAKVRRLAASLAGVWLMGAGVAESLELRNISCMFDVKLPKPPAVLIDGIVSNREHPDTFFVPSQSEKEGVKIGDFVKIGVESGKNGHEKFWVEIIGLVDNGNFVGRVDNDLEDCWGFNYNDNLLIEPRHVLATQ